MSFSRIHETLTDFGQSVVRMVFVRKLWKLCQKISAKYFRTISVIAFILQIVLLNCTVSSQNSSWQDSILIMNENVIIDRKIMILSAESNATKQCKYYTYNMYFYAHTQKKHGWNSCIAFKLCKILTLRENKA